LVIAVILNGQLETFVDLYTDRHKICCYFSYQQPNQHPTKMKKFITILFLLILPAIIKIFGQETNQTPYKNWSVALTFAPLTTFYYYHALPNEYHDRDLIGITEAIYPKGGNLIIDHRVSNRLSISSGLSFKTKKNIRIDAGADMSYYETSTENKYVFEIPVLIKYDIFKSSRFFNPYFKTGLRNSYFKRSYVGEYIHYGIPGVTTGQIDKHEGKYFLFYELGTGTNLNFSKSFSAILESNLTYSLSGFGYLELQAGLRYSFK